MIVMERKRQSVQSADNLQRTKKVQAANSEEETDYKASWGQSALEKSKIWRRFDSTGLADQIQ